MLSVESESGRLKARQRKYKRGYASQLANEQDTPGAAEPTEEEMGKWILAQELGREVGPRAEFCHYTS